MESGPEQEIFTENDRSVIQSIIDDAKVYFGCTLNDFVDSLEVQLYKYFNTKIPDIDGAVFAKIQVNCDLFYGTNYRNVKTFSSGGKDISFYFKPTEEEELKGEYPQAPNDKNKVRIRESSDLQLSQLLKPYRSRSQEITTEKQFKVYFSFSYSLVNISDDVAGRAQKAKTTLKSLFKNIHDELNNHCRDILQFICHNEKAAQSRYLQIQPTSRTPPDEESRLIEENLLKIHKKLLPKLALFMEQPAEQLDSMSVFLIYEDRKGMLYYLFTEQQKNFLDDHIGKSYLNTITTKPMDRESSICYERLEIGVVGFIHNWGQLEIKRDLSGVAKVFLAAERKFLKDTVILIPDTKNRILIGCSGPNLAASKEFSLPKVLKSLRRTVKSHRGVFEQLRFHLNERPLLQFLTRGPIIGNSKAIKTTREQIESLGAYLGNLILRSYEEYLRISRSNVKPEARSIEYRKFFEKHYFPSIYLSGPIGCGKTTHALALRKEVQEYLARHHKAFPENRLPPEFSEAKFVSPDLDKNCSYFASDSSDINMINSYFFGIDKGMASNVFSRQGIFEDISFGQILFFDEIGDLHKQAQGLLLDLLQTRRFFKQEKNPTARFFPGILMFATWKNTNVLRHDFFSRITDYTIHIPPLKDRREDIGPITKSYIKQLRDKEIEERIDILTKCACKPHYLWDFANVRQLKKVLHHMVISIRSRQLTGKDLLSDQEIEAQFEQVYQLIQPQQPHQTFCDDTEPNHTSTGDQSLPTPSKQVSHEEYQKRKEIFFETVTKEDWIELVDQRAKGNQFEGQQYLFQRYNHPYCWLPSVTPSRMRKLVQKLQITKEDVTYYKGALYKP